MAAKAGRLQIQLEMQVAQLQRDLNKANRAIESSTSAWGRSFSSAASVFAGAFLSGAVTAGISEVSQALGNVMQRFDDIADGAKRVGMGTTAFQELAFAAEQSGLSMADMEKALFRMQKGFGTASKDFKKALSDIGLSFDELSRMDDAQRFTTIIDALSKVEDTGKRAANGAAIFGKGVAALGPLMAEGAQGIEALIQKAHDLGIILDEETVKAGEAFNDQMGIMQLQLQALVAKALGPLLPQLQVLAENLSDVAGEALGASDNMSGFQIVANAVTDDIIGEVNALRQLASSFQTVKDLFAAMTSQGQKEGVSFMGVSFDNIQAVQKALDAEQARLKQINADTEATRRKVDEVRNASRVTTVRQTVSFGPDETEETETNTTAVTKNTAARERSNEVKLEEMDLDKLLADVKERANQQWERTQQLLEDGVMLREEANGASRDELEILALRLQGYDETQIKIAAQNQAIRAGTEERARDMARLAEEQQMFTDTIAHGVDDIFFSMTEGSESAKDAVAQLVTELAALYLQMLAISALKQFNGDGTWGFGGVAKGAAFDRTGVMAFAQGGIVRGPTMFQFAGGRGIMGEAGPEAVMPLGRDAQGRLGVRGGGVNINVHNYGGAAVDVQRNGQDIAIMIDQMRGVIANDFARGGNKVTTALEGAYGVRR